MAIDSCNDFRNMLNFVRKLGLVVNTNTLARGHQGFFMNKRIDISSALCVERKKEVLVHEFAHFVHSKIEPDVVKTHGSLSVLFKTDDIDAIEKELICLTEIFDRSSVLENLILQREFRLEKIKEIDYQIKQTYPEFRRSYPFEKFERLLKKSDAKYLLKYDKVKVRTPFLRRIKVYSIDTFKDDFPQFDKNIENYIVLRAHQRVLKRITSRLSRLNLYYKRPSELFARFVQNLYIDRSLVASSAPHTYKRFCELLDAGYYYNLKEFIDEFFLCRQVQCEL